MITTRKKTLPGVDPGFDALAALAARRANSKTWQASQMYIAELAAQNQAQRDGDAAVAEREAATDAVRQSIAAARTEADVTDALMNHVHKLRRYGINGDDLRREWTARQQSAAQLAELQGLRADNAAGFGQLGQASADNLAELQGLRADNVAGFGTNLAELRGMRADNVAGFGQLAQGNADNLAELRGFRGNTMAKFDELRGLSSDQLARLNDIRSNTSATGVSPQQVPQTPQRLPPQAQQQTPQTQQQAPQTPQTPMQTPQQTPMQTAQTPQPNIQTPPLAASTPISTPGPTLAEIYEKVTGNVASQNDLRRVESLVLGNGFPLTEAFVRAALPANSWHKAGKKAVKTIFNSLSPQQQAETYDAMQRMEAAGVKPPSGKTILEAGTKQSPGVGFFRSLLAPSGSAPPTVPTPPAPMPMAPTPMPTVPTPVPTMSSHGVLYTGNTKVDTILDQFTPGSMGTSVLNELKKSAQLPPDSLAKLWVDNGAILPSEAQTFKSQYAPEYKKNQTGKGLGRYLEREAKARRRAVHAEDASADTTLPQVGRGLRKKAEKAPKQKAPTTAEEKERRRMASPFVTKRARDLLPKLLMLSLEEIAEVLRVVGPTLTRGEKMHLHEGLRHRMQ